MRHDFKILFDYNECSFLYKHHMKIWHTACFLERTSYFWCCSSEVLIQTIWSTKYDNYITFFRTVKLFRKSAFLEWPSMNLRMWQSSQVNHKPNTFIIYMSIITFKYKSLVDNKKSFLHSMKFKLRINIYKRKKMGFITKNHQLHKKNHLSN